MAFFYYSHTDFTASKRGSALKVVECEQCQTEFVYCLERTAAARVRSEYGWANEEALSRAKELAEQNLQKALHDAIDPVPCPACGWYQWDMVFEARRVHHGWMVNAGCALFAVIFFLFFVFACLAGLRVEPVSFQQFLILVAVLAAAGIALVAIKFVLTIFLNPNKEQVEIRKQIAKARTMLASELDEMDEGEVQKLLKQNLLLPTKNSRPQPQ
jgi:hypothetical protein